MKILMYAPIFPPAIGGPSTQAHSLCETLHKRGEKVAVLTIGERFEREMAEGYPIYRYPWRYTGTSLDKVIRWVVFPFYFLKVLDKERPDLVHCHSASVLSFIAGLISRAKGIPTVLKFAGDWVWETLSTSGVKAKDFDDLRKRFFIARLMWKVEKWGLSLFDIIWAPSEFRAQNVEKVQGHRRNVRIIYNALALPEGGYHEMKESDPFVVVTANRFIPHKRIPALVEAFSKLGNKGARLVLIGTGQEGEIEQTKKVARSLNIETQAELTGRIEIEEVYKYFEKGSVYVSNSLEEGFPNVFVEAMHFGLPIISTNVGGCHEIVREGETGFLFDPIDQELLAEKMRMLMNDIALRNKMAKASYELSHQYELSIVIAQFMDLYEVAISSRK